MMPNRMMPNRMMLSPSESSDKGRNTYGKEITTGSPFKSPSAAKSIDDVWSDIFLSSFHHHTPPAAAATTSVSTHPSSFQDFFAPSTANPSCPAHSPRFAPTPAATTAIVLSMNSSAPRSNYIHKNSTSTAPLCNCTEPKITSSIKSINFNVLPSSSSSSLPMKRPNPEYCEKHKRLMKNRESAARSRARKQARADELELEVERLTKENAMLKRQQQEEKWQWRQKQQQAEEAWSATPARLNRTLTAPF